MSSRDYYLAGKSVEGVDSVESVKSIIDRFVESARQEDPVLNS
jgi:hypothetical protein